MQDIGVEDLLLSGQARPRDKRTIRVSTMPIPGQTFDLRPKYGSRPCAYKGTPPYCPHRHQTACFFDVRSRMDLPAEDCVMPNAASLHV